MPKREKTQKVTNPNPMAPKALNLTAPDRVSLCALGDVKAARKDAEAARDNASVFEQELLQERLAKVINYTHTHIYIYINTDILNPVPIVFIPTCPSNALPV